MRISTTPDREFISTPSKPKFRYVLPNLTPSFSKQLQYPPQPEESKRTNEAIAGDRKLYLDAAIVRIMKANKTMTYEKLKTATIDAVKNHFVPQVEDIKQRVDSLVESDYLERDKSERNKFHYVA